MPGVDPLSPAYFFPGITHCGNQFDIIAEWATKGSINVRRWTWFGRENPRYISAGEGTPRYFQMESLPNQVFLFDRSSAGIPSGAYTIWERHGDGWFTGLGSGSKEFNAYEGGLSDNTHPTAAPVGSRTYTVELHAYSMAEPSLEIPDATFLLGGRPAKSGDSIPCDVTPVVTGSTATGWKHLFGEVESVDYAKRLFRLRAFMERIITVKGKITGPGGPVPGAAVVLRNRYGNPIDSRVTKSDGMYEFPSVSPQTVYLDVNRRGFVPQRKRYPLPTPQATEIIADFDLKSVPEPTIDVFTMNRFGLFLPGVLKSGDSEGFDPEGAREQLTMTWKSAARGATFPVELEGFVQANEKAGPPEKFEVADRVVEIWLVDRRAFTNAFVNALDQKADYSNDPPLPRNYVSVQNWLGEIIAARKDGKPHYVVHQLARRENRFEGKLNLWELPSGVFKPRLIAITESGGVAVKDYELPPDKQPLQGLNLPEWAASLLELIGGAANAGKFSADVHLNYGDGFLKVGTFSPKFDGRIDLDPANVPPEADAYLTYKYELGLELALGEATSETGPLRLGPKFLGLKLQEATAEFEVVGKEKKAILSIKPGLGKPEKVEIRTKEYRPVILRDDGDDDKPKKKPEASIEFGTFVELDSNWLGNNTISSFGFQVEAAGAVELVAKANAKPVLRFIPYVGPLLVAGDATGALKAKGVFEVLFGARFKGQAETRFPKPTTGSTQVRGDPPQRWSLLGSSEGKVEFIPILRLASGLELSLGRGTVEGTALLQAGAPADAPDNKGIQMTINLLGKGPLITKVEGAFSAVVRLAVNLWTGKIGKEWQFDIHRFVIDRGSEPSFELAPINVTYSVINAASVPQQNFVGVSTNIIERFYQAGTLDLTKQTRPLLIFTGTDPATGQMTVMASLRAPIAARATDPGVRHGRSHGGRGSGGRFQRVR